MNYYERHLGDYARDTAHLSMLEHGAYGLLLDRYYSTESGIPVDQAHRLARARTRDERAAVDAVLDEFFLLTDGLWINGRAGREVVRAQAKINAARENGRAGGRPRKLAETERKPNGLPLGSISVTQEKALQTPDTRHQEEPKTKAARKRAAPAVLVSLPDLVADGVDAQHAADWMVARKSKGAPMLTPTAWAGIKAEAVKARLTVAQAVEAAAGNGWAGFKASWMDEKPRSGHQSAYELKAADAAKWIKGTSLDRSTPFDQEAFDAVTPQIR